jgi:hypothetical protein
MERREHIQNLLSEVFLNAGVEDVSMDGDGFCSFMVDDNMVLNLQYLEDENSLAMFTDVGQVEEENRQELYQTLLEANLFWQGAGGGTLGVDPETQTVVFMFKTPLSRMNPAYLHAMIGNFLNAAGHWHNRIRLINASGTQTQEKMEINIPPFSPDLRA